MPASDRPSERRGAARTAVVWESLRPVLDEDQSPRDVLDIGGGTGGFAVRVAELGHRVSVVDPSPDALASLSRRARERGVEVVDDVAAALATIREVLRPGGTLSLLVAQRHAAVVARAMAGHFQQALALLDPTTGPETSQQTSQQPPQQTHPGRTGRRFTRDELVALVEGAGFAVDTVHGIRVFTDLVPGSLLDLEPG